jgi:hypothetical protein
MAAGRQHHLCKERLRMLLGLLIAFEAILVAAYLVPVLSSPTYTSLALFDLDSESSIPVWFSAVQLFAIAAGCLALGDLALRYGSPHAWFPLLAATAFCYLSVDEAAAIHEKITRHTSHIGWVPRFRGGYGTWVFVYVPLLLVGIAACLRPIKSWVRHHAGPTRWFVTGGAVFFGGAVGLEVASYVSEVGLWSKRLHRLQIAAEELLEMLGASLMLFGVLSAYVRVRDAQTAATGPTATS